MAIRGSHAGRGQEFYALLGRCDPGPAAVPRQLQWHDQQQSLSAAVSQVKRQQYEQAIFCCKEEVFVCVQEVEAPAYDRGELSPGKLSVD